MGTGEKTIIIGGEGVGDDVIQRDKTLEYDVINQLQSASYQ